MLVYQRVGYCFFFPQKSKVCVHQGIWYFSIQCIQFLGVDHFGLENLMLPCIHPRRPKSENPAIVSFGMLK